MEKPLWEQFLEERIDNLSKEILTYGIGGLLASFEAYLLESNSINNKRSDNERSNQQTDE